jgi:hypothetical protein
MMALMVLWIVGAFSGLVAGSLLFVFVVLPLFDHLL